MKLRTVSRDETNVEIVINFVEKSISVEKSVKEQLRLRAYTC